MHKENVAHIYSGILLSIKRNEYVFIDRRDISPLLGFRQKVCVEWGRGHGVLAENNW